MSPRPSGSLYRVRHPAAPGLFVWLAGDYDARTTSFLTGVDAEGRTTLPTRGKGSALLSVSFRDTHPGMSRDAAERLAAFVGGTVEAVASIRQEADENGPTMNRGGR